MMRPLLIALQFLTIIPVRINGNLNESEIASSATCFPLVGLIQGVVLISIAHVLMPFFPPDILGGLLILILILTNGGFHLDGLSDTFDAISVKSTGDKETDRQKRLSVMKDSNTGAMGVLAISLVILLKYLLISRIIPMNILALALMPMLSRWAMLPSIYHGNPARKDGLGYVIMTHFNAKNFIISTILTLIISFIASRLHIMSMPFLLFNLIILYIWGILALMFFKNRFGGLTGDNLGSISETSEIIYLLAAYLWLQS